MKTTIRAVVFLLCLAALSQGQGGAQTNASAASGTATPSAPSTSTVQWRVLRFRLDLHSMMPSKATVTAGSYLIDVINGAVIAPITVQLSDSGSNLLTQSAAASTVSRVRNQYVLTPGIYTIGVRSRPEWSATITVVKE